MSAEVVIVDKTESFESFEHIFALLRHAYIPRYYEYDETNRAYLQFEDCVPVIQGDRIVLRDAKTGEAIHYIAKEKDFERGMIEPNPPYVKVTLYYRSRYRYVILLKYFET